MRRDWIGAACAIALSGLVSQSCAQLDPLDPGCGNKVLEDGEDCDGSFDGNVCIEAGKPNACRYDCSAQACPTGFGCGVDGVCRQPKGEFEAASTVSGSGTVSLSRARVDGDQRDDIVELSFDRVSIRYVDDAGRVEDTAWVPADFNRPVLGDVTGEGREDLLLFAPGAIDGGGLAVFRSSATRSLAATVYASTPFGVEDNFRLFAHDVIPPIGVHEVLAFTDQGILSVADGMPNISPVLEVGDFTPSTVAGFDSGNLVKAQSPCDDLVVALKNASSVDVLSPCRMESGKPRFNNIGTSGHFDLPDVQLPPGHVVRPGAQSATQIPVLGAGVFLAEVNGDGRLDLIVETLDGSGNPSRAFAFGMGDGSFDSGATPLPPDSPDPENPVGDNQAIDVGDDLDDDCPGAGLPLSSGVASSMLEIADFNEDGIGDVVHNYGLSMSLREPVGESETIVFVSGACAFQPWSRVLVDDFNGDAHLDIVAIPDGGGDADYLAGDGRGAFNRFRLRLDGKVAQMTSGDYDGDFRADLLVSVPFIDDDGIEAERLNVLYGQAGGNLEQPVELGTVDPLAYVMSGPMFGDDATADLGVFAQTGNAAILFGSTDRLLLAPFVFFGPETGDEGEPEEETLIAFVTGQFSKSESSQIFALTNDTVAETGFRSWLLESDSLARLTDTAGAGGLELPISTVSSEYLEFEDLNLRVEAADFDGDGLDEVLLLGEDGVATMRLNGQQFERVAASQFSEPLFINAWAPTVVADLDGDGTPEKPDLDVAFATDTSIVVLWNEGGIFDAQAATTIMGTSFVGDYGEVASDANTHPGLEEAGVIFSASALHLNRAPGEDLVVVTDVGTYHLAYAGDGDFAPAEELKELGGGEAIVGGDFTGDGVDDLVIGGFGGLRIFKGLPVNP